MGYLKQFFNYVAVPVAIALVASYANAQNPQNRFSCTKSIIPEKGEVRVDVTDSIDKTSLEVVVGRSEDSMTLVKIMKGIIKCPPPEYTKELEKLKSKEK